MNIKEFLLDNYIWIIVVILLLIITVIGFLADKKKGPKKEKQPPQPTGYTPQANQMPINYQNIQPTSQPQPINYQFQEPVNNNQLNNQNFNNPANFGTIPNNVVTPNNNINMFESPNYNQGQINNEINSNQNFNEPLNQNVTPYSNYNNPVPVEQINQNTTPQATEPMYQPLSEQVPSFAPREVTIPSEVSNNQVQNNQGSEIYTNQVNYTSNGIGEAVNNGQANVNYEQPQQVNFTQPQSVNFVQPQPVQMANQDNFNIQGSSMQQTNNVIPGNTMTNQTIPPQPINFIYGPQQPNNNNQNM